ncbi:hypothetical protein T01_15361 [Trichinella spiralis]|uniref:Uncharacterized protein n=1 Tax=Trichinella spiralis TaxID=6334 RepID=A0A0V1BVQ8_TRISP|nr:hypothetical protein T01_15361 [Trichinella spiralis]
MLQATALLPVLQIDWYHSRRHYGYHGPTISLVLAGVMTDDRLPLWNVHNVHIRTNNHLESWYNWLYKKADKSHVGFDELLQLLIAEQGVVGILINQLL